MPAWALPLILQAGKLLLEYAQRNWVGPPKAVLIEEAPGTPCTIDCRKRGKDASEVLPVPVPKRD